MIKKLREFDKNYSSVFFCIALLIIIIFLAYISTFNKSKNTVCEIPNDILSSYQNYSYDIEYVKDNRVIDIHIKKYGYKYLIEKTENSIRSTYYIYYTDVYEMNDSGKYVKYRSDNIVNGLDNKFLFIDYINEVSLSSAVNVDDNKTCYNNRKLGIYMCLNSDGTILLKSNDSNVSYSIKEKGTITDFNVEIE